MTSLFFHAYQSEKHHEKFHEKRYKMNSKCKIQLHLFFLTVSICDELKHNVSTAKSNFFLSKLL